VRLKRLVLLPAIVAATVATSPGSWTVSDETPPRHAKLQPREKLEVVSSYEGSHAVDVSIVLSNVSGTATVVVIERDDARTCDGHFDRDEYGHFRVVSGGSIADLPDLRVDCPSALGQKGTLPWRVRNASKDTIEFDWKVIGTTHGDGESPPDDAFVHVE